MKVSRGELYFHYDKREITLTFIDSIVSVELCNNIIQRNKFILTY